MAELHPVKAQIVKFLFVTNIMIVRWIFCWDISSNLGSNNALCLQSRLNSLSSDIISDILNTAALFIYVSYITHLEWRVPSFESSHLH